MRTSSNLQVFYLQIFSCLDSIFAHALSFLVTSLDYITKKILSWGIHWIVESKKKHWFQKSLKATRKLNSIFKNCCVVLPPICRKWGSIFNILVSDFLLSINAKSIRLFPAEWSIQCSGSSPASRRLAAWPEGAVWTQRPELAGQQACPIDGPFSCKTSSPPFIAIEPAREWRKSVQPILISKTRGRFRRSLWGQAVALTK